MDIDPIEDAAHPTGTHPTPAADSAATPADQGSGEEEIVAGRNATQRKLDAEKVERDPVSEERDVVAPPVR